MNPTRPAIIELVRAALNRVAVGALVALAVLATPGTAAAQCPPTPATEYAIAAADVVFVGRVVSIAELGLVAQVEVLSIWKGRDLPELVEVRGASGSAASSSDARRFDVDNRLLVIPENSRAPFLATGCSATQAYSGGAHLIPASYQDAAGATAGRPPIAPESAVDVEAELSRSILPLLALIALIGLTWAVIARLRTLEPERVAEATPEPAPPKPQKPRFKRRNKKRDVARTRKVARRTVRRHGRGLRGYRRRQNRQLAAARTPADGEGES